jgi:hypothetical protein
VLHYGADPAVLDGDWLFAGRLPGRSLADLARERPGIDAAPARADFGAALAAVHAVTGGRFGYDDGRTSGATWRAAFTAMLDDLLADAADWAVELPLTPARLRGLVDRHADVLDAVDRPALLHFDGWDGHVLAVPDAAGVPRMTGLVDGERYLFGDPLLDLVSPALYRRIEDEPEHPFLLGYTAATRPPLVLDGAARRRLALYRLHLYLLMTVEMPSRNITRRTDPDRYERLARLLDRELTELGRPAASPTADATAGAPAPGHPQAPVTPSRHWRSMSACPLWRAYSPIMCTNTNRRVAGSGPGSTSMESSDAPAVASRDASCSASSRP